MKKDNNHYATINRTGTLVRIKPYFHATWAFLNARAKFRAAHPELTSTSKPGELEITEFVEKEVWQRIAKELNCKEQFTKISITGSKVSFIIACKTMKKEIFEAVALSNEARVVREKKARDFADAAIQETLSALKEEPAGEKIRREQEIRKELESLPDHIISEVIMNVDEAIEKHKDQLTPLQIEALRKMSNLKEEEE